MMNLNAFYNLIHDMAIILAVVTFAMAFLYLFTSGEEAEA